MSQQRALRIFVSSPGDVRAERLIAERVVQRLQRGFQTFFDIQVVLWEREPLLASEHFQAGITPPSETDIVVVILWSRLGTVLPADKWTGAITGGPVTGTEWEFEDAIRGYREVGRPEVLAYRKRAAVMVALDDDQTLEEQRDQKRRVDSFFRRWFAGDDDLLQSAWRDFADPAELEEMLDEQLQELVRRRLDTDGSPRAWYKDPPFLGLRSYELEDADIFFGRTRARNELRDMLVEHEEKGFAFVLVCGASGSGKSSLVRAGLLADVTIPGVIPGVGLTRFALMRPRDGAADLRQLLGGALLAKSALPELHDLHYGPTEVSQLLDGSDRVGVAIRQGLDRAGESEGLRPGAGGRLVVVVDQFEELYTLGSIEASDRQKFLEAVEALARQPEVWVVATVRSDFLHLIDTDPGSAGPLKHAGRYFLGAPTGTEIGQMIQQPARAAGLRFESQPQTGENLAEVLRDAAGRDRRSLPLLGYCLEQLWQRRAEDGTLTFEAYEALGGPEGAIGARAEQVFRELPADVQATLPRVLRALVTVAPGERSQATARSAPMSAFPKESDHGRLVGVLLDPSARLLIADSVGDEALVRLAHEALLSHWPRARQLVQKESSDLQTREELQLAFDKWAHAESKYKRGLLLKAGLRLEQAADLLARQTGELKPEVVAFVRRSETAARARRGLAVAAIALVTLVLAGSAAAIILSRFDQRESEVVAAAASLEEGRALAALIDQRKLSGQSKRLHARPKVLAREMRGRISLRIREAMESESYPESVLAVAWAALLFFEGPHVDGRADRRRHGTEDDQWRRLRFGGVLPEDGREHLVDLRAIADALWALDYVAADKTVGATHRQAAAQRGERLRELLRTCRGQPPTDGFVVIAGDPDGVGTFRMQAHEVTVREYRLFDCSYAPSELSNDGIDCAYEFPPNSEAAKKPAVSVTWWQAYAYAAWRGGRLPTEAEWKHAFGDAPGTPGSEGGTPCPIVAVTESSADSYGLRGMRDNASEWVSTWRGGESSSEWGPRSPSPNTDRHRTYIGHCTGPDEATGTSPWQRLPFQGFRVVIPSTSPGGGALMNTEEASR